MSLRARLVVVALFAAALLAPFGACGPTRSLCATVTCDGNRVCDEATGACVRVDGGVTIDGGTDGGPVACVPDCVSPQVCDTATGRCVECRSDSDCSCPTTTCGAQGLCELPSPDGGAPVAGESCTTARAVNTCGQTLAFSANLSTARDDVVSSCGAASGAGKDLMWALELDTTFDVRVTVKPSAGSLAQPVVSLRRNCDQNQELACSDGLGGTASFRVKSLPAGFYTLVVDSFDAASSGRVDVTVEFLAPTAPANETCATAAVLTPGTDVEVSLGAADDDLQVSCNSAGNSPEAVWRLDLPAASDVFLTASGSPDAGVDPVLALRRAPCAAADQVACVDNLSTGSETLVARNLAAGTYYVIVENYGRPQASPVTVRATVTGPTPPPSNNTCAAPRAITFAPGSSTATFTTDTSIATDDTAGTCNTEPGSPETVFALTLGATKLVTVSAAAHAGNPTVDAVVYLRGTACDAVTGMELACDDALPPGPDTFSLTLDPGTYYLFVEGYGAAGAGPTDVTVTLAP